MLTAVPALRDDAMLERYAAKALHMDVHAALGAGTHGASNGATNAAMGTPAWAAEGHGEGLVLTGKPALDNDLRYGVDQCY